MGSPEVFTNRYLQCTATCFTDYFKTINEIVRLFLISLATIQIGGPLELNIRQTTAWRIQHAALLIIKDFTTDIYKKKKKKCVFGIQNTKYMRDISVCSPAPQHTSGMGNTVKVQIALN